MVLNIGQAFKMAWRSICGKKGRSALTILSIFIGIAAVMTIVSTMEGMKAKTMEQFAAMGANRIEVSVYAYMYDEGGNPISKDYFTGLYRFCSGLKESIIGITPKGSSNATVVYGTKNSSTMEWKYDQQYNVVSGPPQIYYGSDQYSACNNLAIAKGRDLAWLDCEKYNQICVLGAQAARVFFGSANPVGQIMKVNGNNFEVVGVYGARVEPDTPSAYQTDNFMILPYTATRLLGDTAPTEFLVKAKDDASMKTAITEIGGYLSGVVDQSMGGYQVQKEGYWQDYQNQQLTMISLVLGGIAAISSRTAPPASPCFSAVPAVLRSGFHNKLRRRSETPRRPPWHPHRPCRPALPRQAERRSSPARRPRPALRQDPPAVLPVPQAGSPASLPRLPGLPVPPRPGASAPSPPPPLPAPPRAAASGTGPAP